MKGAEAPLMSETRRMTRVGGYNPKQRPRTEGLWMLTSLVLCEGDDVWVVVVDEAWESACLSTAHADLTVLPLACLWVLSEGHQSPAKEGEL